MKRIPASRGVTQAFRTVRKELKAALKATNVLAGKRISKGDYGTAESLAEKGRAIQQFQIQVQELEKQWRELRGAPDREVKEPTTPLWKYYQPILQALVKAGGESRWDELEEQVERLMKKSFLTGDCEAMSRGRERWQVMIHRARKPLTIEGWIERRGAALWCITKEGRATAARPGGTEAVARAGTDSSRH